MRASACKCAPRPEGETGGGASASNRLAENHAGCGRAPNPHGPGNQKFLAAWNQGGPVDHRRKPVLQRPGLRASNGAYVGQLFRKKHA